MGNEARIKKVVYIEDTKEWQTEVERCLASTEGLELTFINNAHEFFSMPHWGCFGLYILDRHLPANAGEMPNDNSWKTIAGTLRDSHPEIPVVMLSSHPPRKGEFMKYGIKDAISKASFRQNPSQLLFLANNYLGAQ